MKGPDFLEGPDLRQLRLLMRPGRTPLGEHGGGEGQYITTSLSHFDTPVLGGMVGPHQANVEIEDAFRDQRAIVHGERQRIA